MRVATYNVRGLSGKADLVQHLWDTVQLDIIGLTETWMRPTDRFLLPLKYETIALEPAGNRHRGEGGKALAYRGDAEVRVLMRIREKEAQVIMIRFTGIIVALAYFYPSISASSIKPILEGIHRNARVPDILMGDFNSRHTKWDTTTNSLGPTLVRWAGKWRWNIQGPMEPTCNTRMGSSTVDLIL